MTFKFIHSATLNVGACIYSNKLLLPIALLCLRFIRKLSGFIFSFCIFWNNKKKCEFRVQSKKKIACKCRNSALKTIYYVDITTMRNQVWHGYGYNIFYLNFCKPHEFRFNLLFHFFLFSFGKFCGLSESRSNIQQALRCDSVHLK